MLIIGGQLQHENEQTLLSDTRRAFAALPSWVREPTISVTYSQAYVDAAEDMGVPAAQLLDAAQVPAARLAQPTAKLSLQELAQISAAAKTLTGDVCIGFAAGYRMALTAHGNLGFALICAAHAREALTLLARFWHLRGRGALLEVHERDDGLFLALLPEVSVPHGLNDVLFSSMLTSIFRGIEFLLPTLHLRIDMQLSYPEPKGFAAWRERLPNVHFNQPVTGMKIIGDLAQLDTPLPTSNSEGLRTALAQCEQESALTEQASDILLHVRAGLRLSAEGYASPEQLAQTLHMTGRTLRRRLHEQGFRYQALLEEARRRDACRLLADSTKDIRHISERLGYENPANFSRAFKYWTGLSPSQWRKHHA